MRARALPVKGKIEVNETRRVEAKVGGGGSHVACLNFKTSCVSVYKCLSLIVSFAVTVAIWPREVVSCRNFILCPVATFWAMSLVGIYPGRASESNVPPSIFIYSNVVMLIIT